MSTKVTLARVRWSNDYKHTPVFKDFSSLESFLGNLAHKAVFNDFTYQKRGSTMRIPLPYSQVARYNYVVYQNYLESPVCAFITGYEPKGDDQTNITLEVDVMVSYSGMYDLHPCFVEREHVDDDTVGLHTLPENLECGEYVVEYQSSISELKKCDIVIATTVNENMENVSGSVYGGMYSGVMYYAVDTKKTNLLKEWLKKYDEGGKNDAIKSIFLVPKIFNNYNGTQLNTLTAVLPLPETYGYELMDYSINKSEVFGNSYTPKNNKLLCYPYKYMMVANNNGGTAIYQYEHFSKMFNDCKFRIEGCLTPGCSIRITPLYYKGSAITNDEEGLNLGKYPICNWSSDEYTNWLTQNSVNIGLNLASGVGQIVGGTAVALGAPGVGTFVGGGTIAGGISTIASTLGQLHQMSFTPPQSNGNLNCGDVITASEKNTFHFYGMTIKDEYLKIIDEYFNMFGYKCGRVKVPNSNHRSNWWYTKTVDCNIWVKDNVIIPEDDLNKIKECYNKGITFWAFAGNLGRYDLGDNNITK